MSETSVTRAEMVDWISTSWNAEVAHTPRANWRRVNTAIFEQGDCSGRGRLEGFHLLELCHDGRLMVQSEIERESKGMCWDQFTSGSLNYGQANADFHQNAVGLATIQQIYIDDSIFEDVKAGFAAGDPDNLNSVGFFGIFEPRIRQVALSLLEEARSPSGGSDLYADLLGQQLATLILRRQLGGAEKPTGAVKPLTSADVNRIVDHMEADLTEAGGLDTLAALVGRDVFGFARAFKAATGQAPHQFLIARRLDRVRVLLTTTCDPLADIAYATGFASQSHMTAAFSRHVGKPPGAYRKAAKA